jgi:hypothetical protein
MMGRRIFALALVLAASPAFAGFTQPQDVDVDPATLTALGDYVSARYSTDEIAFIGCGLRTTVTAAGDTFEFGFCQARDAAGEELFCTTSNPDLLRTISSIADFSFVLFGASEEGECRRIGVSTQSLYLPRKLDRN